MRASGFFQTLFDLDSGPRMGRGLPKLRSLELKLWTTPRVQNTSVYVRGRGSFEKSNLSIILRTLQLGRVVKPWRKGEEESEKGRKG
jgi:hypothetical protein